MADWKVLLYVLIHIHKVYTHAFKKYVIIKSNLLMDNFTFSSKYIQELFYLLFTIH